MNNKMWEPVKVFPTLMLIVIGYFSVGESAFLRCYNGSLDNYLVVELSQPVLLEEPSCIDRNIPTVLYTFGYRGKTDGPATVAMLSAYLDIKKRNTILLDWQEEAKSGFLGITFGYAFSAVPNAIRIGKQLGEVLVKLNLTDIHLIGHSLGAQLLGETGRTARSLGFPIPRITGLDPAKALYETFGVQAGLDRTCAKFVDIYHTDPQNYGTSKSTGTVDFWPNYGSVRTRGGVQPGCPIGQFEMFTPENLCSHDRAWKYYSESIRKPTSFIAAFALNYQAWVTQGNNTVTSFYGELANPRASGNFFLTTNPSSPYARYEAGLAPDATQRRTQRSANLIQRLLRSFS